ncbi:uncharacterized protein METZ01_LOCUS375284, partial [marine metagenome]
DEKDPPRPGRGMASSACGGDIFARKGGRSAPVHAGPQKHRKSGSHCKWKL